MNGLQSNGFKMDLPSNRWTINRIGLLNFWYYDEEEFYFSDGRLLLRGSNGSGKSVTMQSFIPLLLDGNKSPERLDPFGSRARKLENYLLGEDEKEKEESTAYLYMEFCKKDTGNYLTIGMGLRAKRGRNLNFWGFSITDGRRIGKDFLLYKDTGEKIPLSRIELRNRIGSGGEVLEGQKDYMEMVNRLLFGFESIDEYDELIKLLIQIRTPKLSKDFKPTVIYEIMNNSLQPLSDDDLRPMSEAIENMDNIKDQLEVLKESKTAADRLKSEYDRYNRFVLLEKAKDFAESQDRLDAAGKELTRLAAERDTCSEKHAAYEQEQQDLKHREEIYSHKKEQLEQHDSFRAKEEIEKLEAVLKDTQDRKSAKENTLEEKKGRGRQLERELEQLKNQQEERTESVEKQLEEMDEVASGFWFDEHAFAEAEIQKDIAREYDYGPLRRELDRYRSKIGKAKKALEKEKAQSFQYDRALEDLEGARREKEDVRRELKRTENVLEETREEFIEHAYAWEKQNEWLKLPAEDMAEITRAVRAYDQSGGYDGVIRQVEQHHRDTTLLFQKNILETEAIRNQYRKEADEKREELADWESRREPEPDMAERTIANRQRLDREGISYLPFYKAVDFREEVPEDLRGKLEEAFTEMGLLNALIVPDNKKKLLLQMEDDMGDTYILPSPRPDAHNLSSLLKPVVPEHAGITEEEIDQVLESVLLDKNENLTYLNQSGEYSIGILGGKTSSGSAPKFIGSEARERYKQENIRRLREEIGEIVLHIQEEDRTIQKWQEKVEKLNAERDQFPGKEDLETAVSMVSSARLTLESREKDCSRKEGYAEEAHRILKDIREQVRECTARMQIPLNLEAYEEAEANAGRYQDRLSDLITCHVRLLQLYQQAETREEQQEEVRQDVDDLLYDINRLDWDIRDARSKKQNFEALLKELNYEEIRNEVEECIRILREIPQKLEDAIRNAQIYQDKHQAALESMDKLQEEIKYLEKLNQCLREGFRKEYDLGYVIRYEEGAAEESPGDIRKIARKICHYLKDMDKEGKLREDYAASLQEKYHQNRQYFTEYNLIMEYILDGGSEWEDERLIRAEAGQKRLELSARIQGRNVNFTSLVGFIKESIEENEKLLKESDRQLFEDILANTVGKKIRARIYHSEQWVKKMNSLMESMNTSSGLSFRLVWKNRTAETEEQMDTRELVNILKSDSGLLREEDMEKLSAHFRSKIAQARQELEMSGSAQTFHAIMRDILDYRKWFEFQLFYKKTGETRKELTNNAFDRFSGGEKAMAMYVPLFSAVYARYEGARKDCPRILSLDEAFAGVDENNIRDMFRLLDELQLNFIINSQVLWGDYDTVPSLSICELVRPNNADFVTVIRYKWNGRVRTLVTDEDNDGSGDLSDPDDSRQKVEPETEREAEEEAAAAADTADGEERTGNLKEAAEGEEVERT